MFIRRMKGAKLMKKWLLDDYLLGFPGVLMTVYVGMQIEQSIWRWGVLGFSVISFLITYPWLLTKRPKLRATRSLDRFNQPDMGRKAGEKALGISDMNNAQGNASQQRELAGFAGLVSLVEVWLKRWGLMLISVPWLIVIKLKK